MGNLLLRLRTWWETADRTQKLVTVYGSAFLVLLLAGTFYFASKPKMVQFLPGANPAQVGEVVAELKKLGVPFEYDNTGNLLIPSNKADDVRAQLAAAQKLPVSSHLSENDLSKLGMMSTPSVEREKLKAILEGELATSIESLQGIQAARVHITLGDTSPFANETRPATASVTLTEASTALLGQEQARGIAQMVANAVPGLTLENVFVLNNAGRSLYSGTEGSGASGRANEKLEAERNEASRRERELQATFDQSFGPGATIVKVDLELDFDDSKERIQTPEVSENPVVVETAKESLGKGGAAGVSGSVANGTPTEGAIGGGGSGENYSGNQGSTRYAEGNKVVETTKALGQLKRMSIAVLANEGKKVDPTAVEGYLKGYLGGRAEDPNFQVTVTAVKFDEEVANTAKKSADSMASAARMQQIFSLLPVLALLVVGFMVVKSITKAAKSSQNVLVGALPGGQVVTLGNGVLSSAGGVAEEVYEEEIVESEGPDGAPALTVRKKKKRQVVEEDDEDENIRVGKIAQKLNLPLEQIKRLGTEKPETVAMLIKSWLLEEKR